MVYRIKKCYMQEAFRPILKWRHLSFLSLSLCLSFKYFIIRTVQVTARFVMAWLLLFCVGEAIYPHPISLIKYSTLSLSHFSFHLSLAINEKNEFKNYYFFSPTKSLKVNYFNKMTNDKALECCSAGCSIYAVLYSLPSIRILFAQSLLMQLIFASIKIILEKQIKIKHKIKSDRNWKDLILMMICLCPCMASDVSEVVQDIHRICSTPFPSGCSCYCCCYFFVLVFIILFLCVSSFIWSQWVVYCMNPSPVSDLTNVSQAFQMV